jgi:peptidyl-prolyl cis-trans isomerase D
VKRNERVAAAAAEAAFGLDEGEISEPVEGRRSPVIVMVTDIQPESVTSFEEAKSDIRDTLASQRASDEVLDLYNRIEDERARGASLPEIADMLNLEYVTIDAIDRQGRGPDGEPLDVLPAQDKIVREAFRSDVGVENDPVETEDQGLVWFEVLEVMPEKTRPLEEARDQVIADWRQSQESSRLADMAEDLVERARKGESLEDIAAGLDLEVKQSQPLKREAESEALPRAAVSQAFSLSKGDYGSAVSRDGTRRVIFQVTEINQPEPPDAEEAASLKEAYAPQLADDLVAQYVSGLSDIYGVTRNQELIAQLTGARPGEPPRGQPPGQLGGQL